MSSNCFIFILTIIYGKNHHKSNSQNYVRTFFYSTVEEKIFQRQLSKEGLQSIVDDKAQVNELSTKDLRNLFKLRSGTPSDTHDKLRCERCHTVDDNADHEAMKLLPKQLGACKDLLEIMLAHEDAGFFSSPLKPIEHGVTTEKYEKFVKRPIDLGTIKLKLHAPIALPTSYKSPSAFSKDVNRIFSNVIKCWEPGHSLSDASRRLQSWWTEQWAALVPRLMTMRPDDDKENETPKGDCSDEDDAGVPCSFVENERGEDFQEQLGMPDEENMRHWSHHHNTDTVDDPVFRAAMRGYDSVSFVFGLEVTWSLIQQRQQEEEEKQALLELEAVQELDDADKVDNGSFCSKKENVEGKSDIVQKETGSSIVEVVEDEDDDATWNVDRVYTIDELNDKTPTLCNTDGCQNVACSLWKSDKGDESKVCLTCQNEEFDGWPEGIEPTNRSHKQCIEKICTQPLSAWRIDRPQDTNIESEPIMVKSPAKETQKTVEVSTDIIEAESPTSRASTDHKWMCGTCTFENETKARKCGMCQTKKSPKKRKI